LSIIAERDALRAPPAHELNTESSADVMARVSAIAQADEGTPPTDLPIEDFVELVTPRVPTTWQSRARTDYADTLASELRAPLPPTPRRLMRQGMARSDKELPPPPW